MRLLIGIVALTLLAGCGGSSSSLGYEGVTPPVAKRLLTERLRAAQLAFRWVACVNTGRTYHAVDVVRCNVDFGDPHIEAYCAVLDDGRLVTNHEDAAIPCPRDAAGWSASIAGS